MPAYLGGMRVDAKALAPALMEGGGVFLAGFLGADLMWASELQGLPTWSALVPAGAAGVGFAMYRCASPPSRALEGPGLSQAPVSWN